MELTFKRLENAKDLDVLRQKLQKEHAESDAHRVRVCCGTACQATGSNKLIEQFEKEAAQKQVKLEIVKTGLPGLLPARAGGDPGPAGNLLPEGEGG